MRRVHYLLCGWAVLALAGCAAQTEVKTDYFAIFTAGKKIGYVENTRKVEDAKVTTTEKMVLTLSRGTAPVTVRSEETCVETADGKPISFKSAQSAGLTAMTVEGVITAGGKLTITITGQGQQVIDPRDWPEGAVMREGARLREKKEGLKEGTSYSLKMFVPSFGQAVEAEVKVGTKKQVDLLGRVVRLTEVATVMKTPMGQMKGTTYVDDDFEAQKITVPMMGMVLEIVACNRQFALSDDDVVDFVDKLLVASPVPLEGVASAKAITYHLKPTGDEKLNIADNDYQTVSTGDDGTVIVTVRPLRPDKGGAFPYKGQDPAAVKAVKPARYLQSDSEKIVAAAREAVGDAADAATAVKRIERYVREHISKKDLSVGYATALEALESKQGDCSEHAVLAAALCRSVGIPARVVCGVAYVRRWRTKEHVFGPHAWVEALVGEKWVGLDAALNGHDAGHIAICSGDGGPEDFFGALSTLGCFRITKAIVHP